MILSGHLVTLLDPKVAVESIFLTEAPGASQKLTLM